MQHEAVLCLAEHLDAYQHRDKGAEAADEEHVDVQRDAPHQGAAEARDIPVHRVQLDDLLHVEAADGEGHLGGVVEDGGEVEQRRDKDAPDVHDVPEEHRRRREEEAHAEAEEEEGHQRVEGFKHRDVDGAAGEHHDQRQRHEAEDAVDHGEAALFQREDIFRDIDFFQQGGRAEDAAHAGGGGLVEEVEEQLAAHQEDREVVDAAAPHIHQAAEHRPVHQAHEQGVEHTPHHAQHTAAVFELKVTADEVPQQIAVAPQAVEHCLEFFHRRSPLFKIKNVIIYFGRVFVQLF